MDPLGDLLMTRPIQTGWELSIEPCLSWRFGCIDDPDHQVHNSSVWTQTRTQSDCQEPLPTICGKCCTLSSTYCTGGELSTDRDNGSGNDYEDVINWELLDDSYKQSETIKGELVIRLWHNFTHLQRWTKVHTVHRVYQQRRAGDVYLCGRIVGWAIRYRDIWLRVQLPGSCRNHQDVMRNALHVMEHTTHCYTCGLQISGCRLLMLTAVGTRYTSKCQLTVLVKVEQVLWEWDTRLQGL